MGLPLIPKSLFRHHMQQYEHLANITAKESFCRLDDPTREGFTLFFHIWRESMHLFVCNIIITIIIIIITIIITF